MPQTAHPSQAENARSLILSRPAGVERLLHELGERSFLLGAAGHGSYLKRIDGLFDPLSRPRSEKRCELCDLPIPEDHHHLVNLETRSLLCACPACCRLFTRQGAAGGMFLTVPKRYLFVRDLAFTARQWDAWRIPVDLAFLSYHSAAGQLAAFHPGPAGTIESRLPLLAWAEVAQANPRLATLQPDLEALLIHKHAPGHGTGFSGYIVPIDACHDLLGRLRWRWEGLHGGGEAWHEIDAFLVDALARSCEPG